MEVFYSHQAEVLYTFAFLFISAVFWLFWKYIWPFRNFPSVFFNRKMLTAIVKREFLFVKYVEDNLMNFVINICKKFEKEGICVFWCVKPIVFIFNEEYFKIILSGVAADNKTNFYEVLSEYVGKGLITNNGLLWRKRRNMMNPAFKSEMLRDYVSNFNRCANHALQRLSVAANDPSYCMHQIIAEAIFKATSEIIFGLEVDCDEYKEKISVFFSDSLCLRKYSFYRFVRPWLIYHKIQLLFEVGRKHENINEDSKNFIKYLINKGLKQYSSSIQMSEDTSKDDLKRKSILYMLHEYHLKDSSFTMDDLEEEIRTIFLAASETTSLATYYCLYSMALHQDVQEKAFEEVESFVGDSDISIEDVDNLKYLDSVIKETLRLLPAVPFFSRQTSKDIQCGKYKIPKNTNVVFCIYLLHQNSYIYSDPDKFDPGRFYDKELEHPWAFMPFAQGTRICIGKYFAMLEIKILLAHILRKFKLSLVDKDIDLKVDFDIFLQFSNPMRFKLTKR